MIIVINTQSHSTAYSTFILQNFVELATKFTQHQFIFWLTHPAIVAWPSNCSTVTVKEIPTNKISQKYWYNYKIPALLKKCKATHYFNLAGILSNRTPIHQFLFLALPIHQGDTILPLSLQNYYGRKAEPALSKAQQVITFSQQEKNKIDTHFPSLAKKTSILPLAPNKVFTTLFWELQEKVKMKYTNGNSYFFAHYTSITKDEFTTLLKAFTQFKQWQKSSMHLIIYSSTLPYQIKDLLNSYKYKADVHLMEQLPQQEYASILASAYTFLYADINHYLPLPVLEALQCQVSVLIPNALKPVFNETCAYAYFTEIKSISEQLILLYKDEAYRNKLIETGFQFISQVKSSNPLWEILN